MGVLLFGGLGGFSIRGKGLLISKGASPILDFLCTIALMNIGFFLVSQGARAVTS